MYVSVVARCHDATLSLIKPLRKSLNLTHKELLFMYRHCMPEYLMNRDR